MAWDIRGKSVLVTGATSGIGLEASVELARRGARVTMVGRDRRKTEAAVAEVKTRSGSGEVSFLLCDFSSQAEIRRLAQEVLASHERLDVLINNAGAVNKERRLTVDGIETTFAVNHLAVDSQRRDGRPARGCAFRCNDVRRAAAAVTSRANK